MIYWSKKRKIEINSFRLLELLSKHVYPKSVQTLMRLNVKEAAKFEKMLMTTYHTYLQIEAGGE
jgi:hypothetical protein